MLADDYRTGNAVLPGEGLLGCRIYGEALAEERDVKESPQPRIGTYNSEATTGVTNAAARAMQDAEKLGIGLVALTQIDHEPRIAEAECQLNAAVDGDGRTRLRASDNDGWSHRRRLLLTNLDHREEVPARAPIETATPSVIRPSASTRRSASFEASTIARAPRLV